MGETLEAIRKNKNLFAANIAVSLLIALAVGLWISGSGPFASDVKRTDLTKLDLTNTENRIVSVVRAANPSVVSIVLTKRLPVDGMSGRRALQEIGGGTGFVVTPDGLIVTNKHVVDDSSANYTVYTYDNKKYPATVIAKDPTQDIAILKINNGNSLPYLTFGDSNSLYLGQTVIAIGNVFDQFKNSVSVGVVSGLSRTIVAGDFSGNLESLDNVIQTDAAINPGNSGGPLLDSSERVVGVNVAIARGSANVGFALPANMVRTAVNSVLKNGKILRPYLGIRYVSITEIVKDQFNLPYDYGAYIVPDQENRENGVAKNSPADKAGLKDGDIILEIDGKRLSDGTTIAGIFQNKNAGDVISLKIWHEGTERTIKVRLDEFPIQ